MADIVTDHYELDTVGSAPLGWTNGGTACDVFDVQNTLATPDGTKYMRCDRASTGNAQLLARGSSVSGPGAVEFLMRQENAQETTAFQLLSGGWGPAEVRVKIRFRGNVAQNIEYYDDATSLWTSSGVNWAVDTWYRFRIEVNNAADTYTLYVDNTLCTLIPVRMENYATLDNFDRLLFNIQGDDSNITYVDNFEIYTHKKWIGGTSTNWATADNWAPNGVPLVTDSVRFTDQSLTTNQPVLDQSRDIANLLIDDNNLGPNSVSLSLNGFTLTASKLDHDSGGTIAVGSGTLTLTAAADMNGTITVSTGTVNGDGTWDGTGGTVTFTGAGTLALSSLVTAVAATLTSTAGTVKYDMPGGAGSQTIDPNVTYYNLWVAGSGTKTLGGNLTANNNVEVSAATLEVSTYTLTVGATATVNGGTLKMSGSGGILKIGSGGTLQMSSGTIQVTGVPTIQRLTTSGVEGTNFFNVNFTGGTLDVSQWDIRSVNSLGVRIGSGVTVTKFDNIAWAGTFESTGSPSILLDITAQTATLSGHTFPTSWGTHQPAAGEDFNVRANTSGTVTMQDATGDWGGEDDDNDNGGTVTWTTTGIIWEGNSSVTWSTGSNWAGGTAPGAGDKAIIPSSPVGSFDDPTVTADTTIDLLNIATGRTITINNTITLTVDGDGSGTLVSGSGTLAGSGTLKVTPLANRTLNDASLTFPGLTVTAGDNLVNVTVTDGTTVTVTGVLELANGSLDVGSATLDLNQVDFRSSVSAAGEGLVSTDIGATFLVSGNWAIANGARFDTGPGCLVKFDGTAAQVIDIEGAADVDFNRLTVANSSATVTVYDNSGFRLLVLGQLIVGSGANFVVQDLLDPDAALTFNDGGSNNGTLRLEGGLADDLTELGSTFTPASGTVVYAGAASETVFTLINDVTPISYNNLTIDNTGATTATQQAAVLDINGNFLINDSDASFTASTSDLTLAGNFTNNGDFIASAGVNVTLDGGTQTVTISGAGDTDFRDLTVNGTLTDTLASNVTVTDTLTVTGGTLDTATYTLTAGNITINGGKFTMTGSGTTLKIANAGTLSMTSGTFNIADVATVPKITTSGTEGTNFYSVSLTGGVLDVAELDIRSVNTSGVVIGSGVTIRRFDQVEWSSTFDSSAAASVMLDVTAQTTSFGGHVFPASWGTHAADIAVRANTSGIVSMEDATGDWAGEDDDSDNGGTVNWIQLGAKANLFDDTFHGQVGAANPVRWYPNGSPTVAIVQNGGVAADEDEYCSITRSLANEGGYFTFNPVTSGKMVVEWLARKSNTTDATEFYVTDVGAGSNRAQVRFSGAGNIQYYNGTGWVTTTTYAADTWYRWRLELNEDADTFDVYLNNASQVTGVTMQNNGTAKMGAFEASVRSSDSNTTLVDDVEVYTHKKWIGGTSANWATAANWAPSGVPAVSDTVRFTDQTLTTNQPDLDSSRTVAGMLIDDDGFGPNNTDVDILTFALTDSGVLTLDSSGNLDVASGTVTAQGAADVDGTITLTTGTVNGDGSWDGTGGTITLTGAGSLILSNTVTAVAGTLTGTVGTVRYDAAVNQTVDTGLTYF
ncbi:MAG: hypothetical protein HYY13_05380, partial [Nitrospirae bacterium]|nr:hypothetical protein [Nitrospirota bacterium]